MGMDVHWRDERGETLAIVEDAGMLLSRLSNFFSGQSASVCLRFIDPFGDTCFNQHQIPVLLSELRQALASVSRSEEHTSELQSLMRISYAVFCLKKKKNK